MHYVYILYSASLSRFYTGETSLSPVERLKQHNGGKYDEKFTRAGIPWELFLTIGCLSAAQAIKIERHIKDMKSTTYIENLKRYPEMIDKLKLRYA
jgi:putative endonuclease